MNILQILIICVVCYLTGSIPSGKILGQHFKKIDIQKHGSGNIGFANAYRVLGPKLGVVVLLLDIAKSFVPLAVIKYSLNPSQAVLMAAGMCAIMGHAFPLWLHFKGGKSIATGFGVMLVLSPAMAGCGLLTYLVVFAITHKSAFGSLAGAWCLVAAAAFLRTDLFAYSIVLACFAMYTHRSNISQLMVNNAN